MIGIAAQSFGAPLVYIHQQRAGVGAIESAHRMPDFHKSRIAISDDVNR
jgi:hypothetical protein